MSDEAKYVVFVEHNGRTIYGLEDTDKCTETHLAVRNPAVIFVNANQQSGQFGVQVVPYLFREFAKDGTTSDQVWLFNRDSITLAVDLEIDARLSEQHTRIYSAIAAPSDGGIVTPAQVAAESAGGKVVKLFDDK